ncbi:CPBP family glutamic-type intramembrane protease [Pseudonocardia ailaonensis]|uniref:CPBP family glutamic-type intramembrane protease n=1 Tax=Pseudonocardia ailaonensis TaxID=367279 RepID=UPI0031E43A4F
MARGAIAAVALLVATNLLVTLVWPAWVVPWNVLVTALLLLIARLSGLSLADVGLGGNPGRGLAVGGVAVLVVAAGYGLALAFPATRAAFVDTRAAGSVGALLYAALLRIPFGTVLLEEVAFRGVLPALAGGGWWRGTLVSSALFGLWHVIPSLGLNSANAAVGAVLGSWGDAGRAALAVLFTFGVGVVLCWLRRRGGDHLAAPALAHLATNCLGVVAAWALL